jgi:hypothetical protein
MILRFSLQPDSLHSQIFRKAGQKKAEPNIFIIWRASTLRYSLSKVFGGAARLTSVWIHLVVVAGFKFYAKKIKD